MRPRRSLDPVRQIVGIGIAGIEETAGFHHQSHGIDRGPPGVPAERTLAGRLGVNADRLCDLRALLGLRHVLVLDPFQAVTGDIPAGLLHGRDHFGIALQRGGDTEHGRRQLSFGEHPPQPPEAGARTIFEHQFDIGMALTRPGLRAQDIRQKCFGGPIAVQNVVLAALLEIHHELNRDPRAARPVRIGRIAPVAAEIARVSGLRPFKPSRSGFFARPSTARSCRARANSQAPRSG